MSGIFVSHSSKDQRSATELLQWLQKQEHTSYFLSFDPEKGITVGKHWEDELYRQLRRCRAVVALLSPNWLASHWCFAEVTQARASGKPVFLAKIAPCETDGLFDDVQQVNLTEDAADGYRRLARGLKEVGLRPGEAFEWDPSRPPYPGLPPFEEEDAAVFFGRDREIQKGLEMLEGLRHRGGPSFVLCLGASGSGKSSLMRAGLIPHLRKKSNTWLPITPFRPQQDPLEELAITLARTFENLGQQRDWSVLYEQLYTPSTSDDGAAAHDKRPSPGQGLVNVARDLRVLAGNQPATVVVAVDEAEELFGYSDVQKSCAFLRCLRGALETGGNRLMAIATMRSDSLGSFQMHSELQEFAYEPLTVAPISLRELPHIIQGPAHLADIELEPGLVQTLVQDASTGDALPLLAFTLRELYEKYGQDGRLAIREYEDLGRLEGSVRRAADMVIDVMSPSTEELAALRAAFVPAMVRVNEEGEFTRRSASWLELPPRAQKLIQRFIDGRLLTSHEVNGEQSVEVAHEALLRVWPRLNGWLREDRDNLRILDDLRHAAEEWQTHDREDSWLVHHGGRLKAIEDMVRERRFLEQIGAAAKAYLEACVIRRREEQERLEREQLAERKRVEAELKTARRTRVAAGMISVVALLAIGAATYGWHQAVVAEKERNQALLSQSKALSSVSRERTDRGQATLGMLLALEALPKDDDKHRSFVPSAEAALLHALFAQRELRIVKGHTGGVNTVRFSPQHSLIVTASRDGTARLLDATSGESRFVLEGHQGQIYHAEFSADGNRVVTASSDHTARIWSTETGQVDVILTGHDGDVYVARFSPSSSQVVTASSDKTARLWDAVSGQLKSTLQGHKNQIYWAEFSPDGSRLATASADHTARLWNPKTGETTFVLRGHDGDVVQATFSPDGDRIVTASWDRTAVLWDVMTGAKIAELGGHEGGVASAAFAQDGALLVTTSADGTARLWNCVTGDQVAVLKGHQGQVHDAQFSADDRSLVTAADDGTARLWEVATGATKDIFAGHNGRVWATRFSPDGTRVATASEDNTVRIWEIVSETVLSGHRDRVHRAMFAPNGRQLATVSDDHTARIWDAETGVGISALTGHGGQVWYGDYSEDGRHLLTTSTDGTAKLWDLPTGRLRHTFGGHEGLPNHADISPDGRKIITGGRGGTAWIWDSSTGERIAVLSGHSGAINFIEFSPDGRRILTTSQDHSARLWDASTGELIAVLLGHRGPITSGAFSSDNRWVATASWDETTRIWEAHAGDLSAVLEGHTDAVLSARFSPNSELIVTGSSDNSARIWNAVSGESLRVLRNHTGEVVDVSFSSDGRLVLTASWDSTARIWHVASGLSVATLDGHYDSVVSAAFSPDGQHVVTASWDGTARLWKLPVGAGNHWGARARERLPRTFAPDERRLYLKD